MMNNTELKKTKTGENLKLALAGESIARNKYTYFADLARKQGNSEVADALDEMAKNEMTHARLWYELLNGKPSSVKECLTEAANGEFGEWNSMYPKFAEQARADGREDIAVMFEHVADIERSHENRFMTMLVNLQRMDLSAKKDSAKEVPVTAIPRKKKSGYRCQFCGAIYDERPDVCGVCQAIGAFDSVEYYE